MLLPNRLIGIVAEAGPRDADALAAVDGFRRWRVDAFGGEILALSWRPRAVWFQLGIRHDGAALELARAGIDVVQDRCMMPEHRRLVRETA